MRTLALILLLPACTWVDQEDWDRANDRDGDGHLALVNGGDDCDDDDAAVHPGADERCNGVDDDCDGLEDEDPIDAPTWYPDADEDDYGDGDLGAPACSAPEGWLADAGDCDDGDAAVHPEADELCNEVDDDCDGDVDEDPTDAPTWYPDEDDDQYGDSEGGATSCEAPEGWVADDTDCDDTDATIHPGAIEWCDGIDTDCDQLEDPSDIVSFMDGEGVYTDVSAAFQDDGRADLYEMKADGTLFFCPGTYTGLISVSAAAASIVGRDGAEATVLSGASDGAVISTTAGASVLSVSGLTITDGAASEGGGLYLAGVTFDLEDLHIDGNLATAQGGGLYAAACSGTASGLRISGNTSRGDGGGAYLDATVLTLSDSTVSDNQCDDSGGGLFAIDRDTDLSMTTTLVTGNQADNGGGLYLDDADVSCRGAMESTEGFHGNTATTAGGGVTVDGNQASFSSVGCDFGADEANNTPDDVFTTKWSESYWYADDADFECEYDGCG